MKTTYKLQFYADKTDHYSNKLFSFEVSDKREGFKVLLHFHCRKNKFRAIYFVEKIEAGNATVWYSSESIPLYNFFLSYDSSHYPTLQEAINDYLMFIH